MTYGHLQAPCLYTVISSVPDARYQVWEAFTFTFIIWLSSPELLRAGPVLPQKMIFGDHLSQIFSRPIVALTVTIQKMLITA